MIYCVIPPELADELFDKMVEYYKDNPNVTVIIDRRVGPDRRNRQERGRRRAQRAARRSATGAGRAIPGTFPETDGPASDVDSPPWRLTGTKTFQNYIGGEWVDAASGETFESVKPGDRRHDRHVPALRRRRRRSRGRGGEGGVRGVAARAGAEARRDPLPLREPPDARRRTTLTDLMTHEMGKVKAEAGGDVQEAIDMSLYMAGEGRRLFGQTTPSELRDKFNMSVRHADRRGRRDHAVELPDRDSRRGRSRPALVCGNTVVFKPATDTPLLGERFVELLDRGGAAGGRRQHRARRRRRCRRPARPASRRPRDHAHRLARDRRRGDAEGRADNLKHVHLELGGKNAIIVLDDADLELAVDGILWSAFGTSGQRCTAASRVIVQEGVYDALQSRLVAARGEAAARPRLGGRHRRRPGDQQEGAREDPLVHGDRQGRGREAPHRRRGRDRATASSKGFFYRPTIFGDVDPQMRIAQEEIFGPTTALIRVRDFDEAIRVSNGIKFGLSSSIFTRDVNKAFRAMRDLEAGITYINAGTIGAEVHLPFGGTKDTGNGHREAGQAALDVFTEWKSIYVDYSGKLQKAQIDNSS